MAVQLTGIALRGGNLSPSLKKVLSMDIGTISFNGCNNASTITFLNNYRRSKVIKTNKRLHKRN